MSAYSPFENLSLDERKIVVGVDFGTTFSGLAWAEERQKDQVNVLDTWPSSLTQLEGTSDAKVPTQLRYTQGNIEWGFQIPSVVERHEWFKLCLTGASPRKTISAGPSRSPEELTSDYLSALINHLRYILGQKLGAAVLRSVSLEYVLTVPAIWDPSAREKTLAACRKAGIDSTTSVSLVSEPEAAAIYTLSALDTHDLEVGDTFVLCDAGGGTVDLISYTISALFPKLRIKEAAPGTGDFCGSTFLDESFSNYLTLILSDEPGWDSEVLAEAMSQFNTIKRQYSPVSSSADAYSVTLPGFSNNDKLGILRGRIIIKPSQMQDIFDPVISKVIALVHGQIIATEKSIKAVLLVGGFGQNVYLKERLRRFLGSSIEVRQPPHSWTAVVRGAVMMGSPSKTVQIQSRVARKHYGIEMEYVYDARGKTIEVDVPVKIGIVQPFKVSSYPQTMLLKIFCDSVTETAPIHSNSNVKSFAQLEADLSQIPKSKVKRFIQRQPDGCDWYMFSGTVEATFGSASMKYVLVLEGVQYDIISADYSR
ncbi:hypothetical protein MMC31_001258 [Peltigera leucophlebia]|nr:hypothetical protein [Peltigera leucophlebia]